MTVSCMYEPISISMPVHATPNSFFLSVCTVSYINGPNFVNLTVNMPSTNPLITSIRASECFSTAFLAFLAFFAIILCNGINAIRRKNDTNPAMAPSKYNNRNTHAMTVKGQAHKL